MNSIRITVATLLVGAVTYAGTAAPSFATDPDPVPAPLPAVEALEAAQDLHAGKGEGKDATQVLVDLFQVLPELDGSDRRAAQRLMARPDGSQPNSVGEPKYGLAPKFAACGDHICVHYVKTGVHAVAAADTTGVIGIPDWAERTLTYLEASYTKEVTQLGFRAPRPDGDRGEVAATTVVAGSNDAKIDVYLAQLQEGYFGYAQPEEDWGLPGGDENDMTKTAHMVLDVDMAGLGCATPPIACLQATAAHEFFHVVQFAYDVNEPGWLMESTATWAEEQVFDTANDNRNYLPFSSLRKPHEPLDTTNGLAEYGNWIFWEFVSSKEGPTFVRALWSRASLSMYTGLNVVTQTLVDHGTTLARTFAEYGAVNNSPRTFYSEGSAYPSAEVTRGWTLTRATRSTGWQSTTLKHLSSRNFVFVSGSGLTETNWRLVIDVNGPSSLATTAYALVFFKDGRVVQVPITLNGAGDGSRQMDFSSSRVAKVTVNLGNASGADNRVTSFRATAKPI